MTVRPIAAVALTAILLAAGSAGAERPSSAAGASASAFAIKVVVPGQSGAVAAAVSAPPDSVAPGAGTFVYPGENAVVTADSYAASALADSGANANANASSQVGGLSLFGGEVTVGSVSVRVRASTAGRAATGDLSGVTVSGMTVLGQAVSVSPNARVPLADWGYATVLEQASTPGTTSGAETWRGFVTAVDIHLTAAHGGLPADSEIQVGYAETSVQAASPPASQPVTKPGGKGPAARAAKPKKQPHAKSTPGGATGPIRTIPNGLAHPKLTAGGYVFPVYGTSSFTDTFGAPRADTGWHHGDDIFAPLGAPILAVADGIVFSVGWNDVGGNRLWLRDGQGNEFYYAHLSAFSPLAKNGNQVHAGDVLGFVGNTGDAAGTPYHLHFEIHPVSLLYMGYDGAVDPTTYLEAWRRLQDVPFSAAAGWVPAVARANAPKPGAVLLQASDISEASGLDPDSLRRAFSAPVSAEGDGVLIRAAHLAGAD